MPKNVWTEKRLSALQLEAVVLACQTFERLLPTGERRGFFLGDGAGVGKGFFIEFENFNNLNIQLIT